jgi:hypothetical protein
MRRVLGQAAPGKSSISTILGSTIFFYFVGDGSFASFAFSTSDQVTEGAVVEALIRVFGAGECVENLRFVREPAEGEVVAVEVGIVRFVAPVPDVIDGVFENGFLRTPGPEYSPAVVSHFGDEVALVLGLGREFGLEGGAEFEVIGFGFAGEENLAGVDAMADSVAAEFRFPAGVRGQSIFGC